LGRCRVDRRLVGDVIRGGNGGWFGFEDGEEIGDGEVAGDDVVSSVGDMTAVILKGRVSQTSKETEYVRFVQRRQSW
jgi:hypothetical protein